MALAVLLGIVHAPATQAGPRARNGKILFLRHDSPRSWDVMTMDHKGKVRKVVPGVPGQAPRVYPQTPRWSPDGRQIAFSSFHATAAAVRSVLYVMPAKGGEPRAIHQLTDVAWHAHPEWSPDGERIIYERVTHAQVAGVSDIWTIAADGSGVPTPLIQSPNYDFTPRWSPDGRSIAFVRAALDWGSCDVYLASPDGTSVQQVTDFATQCPESIEWSPDGRWLALELWDNQADSVDLFRIRPDGSNLERLTKTPYDLFSPVWSPDGKEILFSSDRDGDLEIYSLRLSDRRTRQLTRNSITDIPFDWAAR